MCDRNHNQEESKSNSEKDNSYQPKGQAKTERQPSSPQDTLGEHKEPRKRSGLSGYQRNMNAMSVGMMREAVKHFHVSEEGKEAVVLITRNTSEQNTDQSTLSLTGSAEDISDIVFNAMRRHKDFAQAVHNAAYRYQTISQIPDNLDQVVKKIFGDDAEVIVLGMGGL